MKIVTRITKMVGKLRVMSFSFKKQKYSMAISNEKYNRENNKTLYFSDKNRKTKLSLTEVKNLRV